MVIGHCIGNVKSLVLQMDIFNTDFAHICYVITFSLIWHFIGEIMDGHTME